MNKFILGGFISSDLKMSEIKLKDGNTMNKLKFSIACQRKGKDKGCDFLQVVALDKTADTLQKWFSRGKGIYVEGRITSSSYTNKEGKTVYVEERLIESWEFPPIRKSEEQSASDSEATESGQSMSQEQTSEPPKAPDNEFMDINSDEILDSLPFR